jgi:Co/Zn/Cd efflux system component
MQYSSVLKSFTGAPRGIEFDSVKEVLLSLKMVKSMHNLRVWALTAGQTLVSVHVAIGQKPTLLNLAHPFRLCTYSLACSFTHIAKINKNIIHNFTVRHYGMGQQVA